MPALDSPTRLVRESGLLSAAIIGPIVEFGTTGQVRRANPVRNVLSTGMWKLVRLVAK